MSNKFRTHNCNELRKEHVGIGNPAKKTGWISTNGNKLDENLKCPETGEEFILDGEILRKK